MFAHPDDESFGAGGTLARYAAGGIAVSLVCATRGEVTNFGVDESAVTTQIDTDRYFEVKMRAVQCHPDSAR